MLACISSDCRKLTIKKIKKYENMNTRRTASLRRGPGEYIRDIEKLVFELEKIYRKENKLNEKHIIFFSILYPSVRVSIFVLFNFFFSVI